MKTMEQVILDHFVKVGEATDWSTAKMAKILDISKRTVTNYKKKYDIGTIKPSKIDRIKRMDEWYNKDKW